MNTRFTCDVAVIGGGPSGLSAATSLKQAGLGKVVVLDRESTLGGAVRHCGHRAFSVLEHKKLTSGQVYAEQLVRDAAKAGVELLSGISVTGLLPGGEVRAFSSGGPVEVKAKKVLLATGTRETPRSARLVSGARPAGICTTGTLQSMYYFEDMVPFRRPVVIGTEIVSFSALFTCRKAGIRPVAMVEEAASPTVAWPLHYLARYAGVPLYTGAVLRTIKGIDTVRSVVLELDEGVRLELDCDGVLSGSLLLNHHLCG